MSDSEARAREKLEQEQRDRDLVERVGLVPGGQDTIPRRAFAQLIIDLRNAMTSQNEATTELGQRVERLNRWLLGLTVVIAILTVVQAAAAIVHGARREEGSHEIIH